MMMGHLALCFRSFLPTLADQLFIGNTAVWSGSLIEREELFTSSPPLSSFLQHNRFKKGRE
jgi:hypothetical protein